MQRALSILTFVAALFFTLSPFFVAGFNGFEADQFPVPQDSPPIQPAGYAFSIWGLIYLWLIAGTGLGLFARHDSADWKKHRAPLFISLAVGASWLAVAQMSPVWATVLIWGMLVTALSALLRAGSEDRWLQREPIGAYAGWLTAASSVSIGLLLAGYGYMSGQVAAYVGLGVALAIAVAILKARPDSLAYPGAMIWALIGVIVANAAPLNIGVAALAALGAAYLGWGMWQNAQR